MDLNDDDMCLIKQAMEWTNMRIEQIGEDDVNKKDLHTRAWMCMRMVQLLTCLPSANTQDANMPEDFEARVDALAKKYAPNARRECA